jgi:hypothetical protein
MRERVISLLNRFKKTRSVGLAATGLVLISIIVAALVGKSISMPTRPTDVSLNCQIEQNPASLIIRWTVSNRGPMDIGIFNRVRTREGDVWRTDKNTAYFDLDGDTLVMQRLILPIPNGLSIYARIVPGVMRVAAHADYSETAELVQPIEAYQPYREALLNSWNSDRDVTVDAERKANNIKFALGYLVINPDLKLIPLSAEKPDVFRVWPLDTSKEIIVSCAYRLQEPVRVLDYALRPRP